MCRNGKKFTIWLLKWAEESSFQLSLQRVISRHSHVNSGRLRRRSTLKAGDEFARTPETETVTPVFNFPCAIESKYVRSRHLGCKLET